MQAISDSSVALAKSQLSQLSDSLQMALMQRALDQSEQNATAMGLVVALLGVLFAAFAIYAAFILWRQSARFDEAFAQELAQHRSLLDGFIEEKKQQIAAEVSAIADTRGKLVEELKVEKQADRRAVLERELRELETRVQRLSTVAESVPARSGFAHIVGSAPHLGRPVKMRVQPTVCERCGSSLTDPNSKVVGIFAPPILGKSCPRCRHFNDAQTQWVQPG